VGFTLLSRSYYYLRRRSPGPPFPPDHRQAGERGAIIQVGSPYRGHGRRSQATKKSRLKLASAATEP
jgi:hypothetical protein